MEEGKFVVVWYEGEQIPENLYYQDNGEESDSNDTVQEVDTFDVLLVVSMTVLNPQFISSYLHYRNVIVTPKSAFSNEFICNTMTRF